MPTIFHDESRLREYTRRATAERGQLDGPEACVVDVLEWPPSMIHAFYSMRWKTSTFVCIDC